jgi:hypothetical protein
VGGGENIMVASLHPSSSCFCKEPAEGIIWREKKLFPAKSGKYPGRGGKKPLLEKMDNGCGHSSCPFTPALLMILSMNERFSSTVSDGSSCGTTG